MKQYKLSFLMAFIMLFAISCEDGLNDYTDFHTPIDVTDTDNDFGFHPNWNNDTIDWPVDTTGWTWSGDTIDLPIDTTDLTHQWGNGGSGHHGSWDFSDFSIDTPSIDIDVHVFTPGDWGNNGSGGHGGLATDWNTDHWGSVDSTDLPTDWPTDWTWPTDSTDNTWGTGGTWGSGGTWGTGNTGGTLGCDCTFDFAPVCADGMTFPNACMAECMGHTTYTDGNCP